MHGIASNNNGPAVRRLAFGNGQAAQASARAAQLPAAGRTPPATLRQALSPPGGVGVVTNMTTPIGNPISQPLHEESLEVTKQFVQHFASGIHRLVILWNSPKAVTIPRYL